LILLDLQLPKKDGRQLLEEIKADERLRGLPVIVLTASTTHQKILESEKLHVEAYLVKPVDCQQFVSVVKSLRRYLLADVIMPA